MQGDDAEHGSADTAGIRRIHFIYTRALRKFRGDLRLWTKYFAFCRDTNSTRSLDKVRLTPFCRSSHSWCASEAVFNLTGDCLQALTQALQLHPHVPGLWSYAASWELEKRNNMDGARALMMRGLRNCKTSERLWQEYFKLELIYAARLKRRREVLGLDDIPALETETDAERAARKQAQAAVLNGAVARVAFKKAVQVP